MRKTGQFFIFVSITIFINLLISCGGGEESTNLPQAQAGPDQVVVAGSALYLNGGNSSDPDNKPLSYTWEIVAKPESSSISLSDETSRVPMAIIDAEGTYLFKLVVNNGEVDSPADYVTVTTQTREQCIQDSICGINEFCMREAESCGGVGICTEIPVTCELVDQPVCGCNKQTYANQCEANSDAQNVYYFGGCIVADAGPDQSAEINEVVSLIGELSYDPDGDAISYEWTIGGQPTGSIAELTDDSSATTGFTADKAGNYVVMLKVSDGKYIDSDAVVVTVLPQSCTLDSECGPSEFCEKSPGDCAGTGVCSSTEGIFCFANVDPVCGCNGQSYSNSCVAFINMINVQSPGYCVP